MEFPKNEWYKYRLRLAQGLPSYTTRVSSEQGKYKVGDVHSSPFGLIHIDEVRSYKQGVEKHPFYNELTNYQKGQILGNFDVIKFSLYR